MHNQLEKGKETRKLHIFRSFHLTNMVSVNRIGKEIVFVFLNISLSKLTRQTDIVEDQMFGVLG
jgi:hypothetical protein